MTGILKSDYLTGNFIILLWYTFRTSRYSQIHITHESVWWVSVQLCNSVCAVTHVQGFLSVLVSLVIYAILHREGEWRFSHIFNVFKVIPPSPWPWSLKVIDLNSYLFTSHLVILNQMLKHPAL